jgi:4-amino-4-deoxy-L-arabinose transferase-like glycosyltransferase
MSIPIARVAVLVLAAILRLWHLDQNGYDNEYYAAAVRSMASGWHAFLYNAFDPAGFVSVDKPPVALWLQALAVKLFGFHGLTVLLPQVLEGVAAVALLDYLVRRRLGAWAGWLAGLFLAVMPVSVATDRSNNTESCLVLVLLLAAWALLVAAERGSRSLLLLSGALISLGFNVKMLAAFVVLPAFALVYMLGEPLRWRRRMADLVLAGFVLVTLSLSWAVVYDLTPPDRRPFAGSTKVNSMMELAVDHNGLGRFVRLSRSPVSSSTGPATVSSGDRGSQAAAGQVSASQAPGGRWARLFVRTPVGPLRLADGQLAGQVGWLLPWAILGVAAGIIGTSRRLPLDPVRMSLLLWTAWAITYGVVYSYAGGIFHYYYLVLLAPPLAALAGVGVTTGWALYQRGGWPALIVPAALLATAAWQLCIEGSAISLALPAGDWRHRLHAALGLGAVVASAGLVLVTWVRGWGPARRAVAVGFLTVGLLALLLAPTAWALSSVLVKGVPVLPSADLARLAPGETGTAAYQRGRIAWYRKLIAFLESNRKGERYLLATSTTRVAAPIIIETGEPVMAMGGFHGLDPILTPEKLAQLVASNQVRFVMQGDLSLIDRRMGAGAAGKALADWIRDNGHRVDPALWRAGVSSDDESGGSSARREARAAGGLELYDLKRGAELVPARTDR